ncbi:MAG: hypothetical protein KF802_06920 [Bdellovibrionaceae bacterium]|nr:hypothetical protein [Pseudobdellovibrionaceae bacterium]MBX3034362.1 hypothetical protein [Pseudobdellovibrionaceae bacterium]
MKIAPLAALFLLILSMVVIIQKDEVAPFESTLNLEARRLDELVASPEADEAHWERMAGGLNRAGAAALREMALDDVRAQNERTLAVYLLGRRPADFGDLLQEIASADHPLFHVPVSPHSRDEAQREFEAALRLMAASVLSTQGSPLANGSAAGQ